MCQQIIEEPEVRYFRILLNVAQGRLCPTEATSVFADEVRCAFERGRMVQLAEKHHTKTPPQEEGASTISVA